MTQTVYEKELARMVSRHYGRVSNSKLISILCEIGVVDLSRCQVLAIRRWVEAQVGRGVGKVTAMWQAAEHFAVTYEFVRKAMYYYKDINL